MVIGVEVLEVCGIIKESGFLCVYVAWIVGSEAFEARTFRGSGLYPRAGTFNFGRMCSATSAGS